MKFTLSWLKEYLETNASLEEICDKLTAIGLEIEEVTDKGRELEGFKSVLVEEAKPHPDSDHLNICRVKIENGEALQIVCGASNAKSGMKAVLAPVGSVIPTNQMKIKKSKIRGVESQGMLCSAKELGLGEDAKEIIELDQNVELGKSIAEVCGIDDPLIEINLTPNRGDCLGVYGIARDLAAAGIGELKELKLPRIDEKFKSPINLTIDDKDCPCFAGRYIKGIKNCESPDWLKEKLKAIGSKPINAVVDITNYVLFTYGKPLHTYNADKINGGVIVRKAKNGEKFVALDENEYILDKEMTVIADSNKPMCIGGIMGGIDSGTELETKNIFLESALFNPISNAKTGRKLGLESDSRYRFERGVDSAFVEKGLNIATHLILEICGGKASKVVKVCNFKRDNEKLDFDINIVENLLGIEVERSEIIKILIKLGFKIQEDAKNLDILHLGIPTWRNDISIKQDIVEEIARIYGYDNLASTKLSTEKIESQEENEEFSSLLWKIRQKITSKGLDEVISWAFMSDAHAQEFLKLNKRLKLLNPISSDLNYMRPSLIPNLLGAIEKNANRGFKNLCFFELGSIYLDSKPEEQKQVLSGVRCGKTSDKNIYNDSREFDVFDVKKDLLDCLEILGFSNDKFQITNDTPDYYHPNRSGAVMLGKNILGCFGEIHPLKSRIYDINERVTAFEIYFDNLSRKKLKKKTTKEVFKVLDLQPVSRDFSFILNKNINISELTKLIRSIKKEIITNINIFDIYEGKNVDEDKKSVAFNVVIQPQTKTMTGEEIDAISNEIITAIEGTLGGILRDS
ncbi:phenylalanine--tRNA ligase subunit beta [Pseudomonadota bacterium]